MDSQASKGDFDSQTVIEEKITKAGHDPVIKKYAKGKLLGKGGFAKCYEVTCMETKRVLAAKIILKASLTKSRAKQKLISEIKIHKSLKHNNVVAFEHVFEDQENVYILLEVCSHQSLHDLIKRRKRLTEIETQNYTMQIITALKYLHARKVIHRDLKLGNLFLNDKMELKLGDFGLAAKLDFDGEKKRTVCGTPNYIAPEIIEGKAGHSYEVDIWSLGVMIYALLVGRPPFETNDVKLTYKKIKACSYSFPEHVPVSDNAKNLITRILTLDPSKRPTLEEIMQHPFMKNGNNIPKFLPVSTLACPPSSSYISQFTAQENIVKVPAANQSSDTQPLATRNGKSVNTQKNNLFSSAEKNTITSPSSPAVTTAQTNENVGSVPNLDRQNSRADSRSGFNFTRTGPWQLTGASSATSLKDSVRPHTVNQRDLKSTQNLKGAGGLGNNLRLSGSSSAISRGAKVSASPSADIWVKKWVDYSSKYGMGYILSDGTFGVFFNDNTKLSLDMTGTKYEYVQRNKNDRQDQVAHYNVTDFPKDLQKKVTLLQHFRNYLDATDKSTERTNDKFFNDTNCVYVKKWVKTKNATMFRLSNKIVQVNFVDKTEIILNSENKQVTYVNKKGDRTHYPLTTALENGNSEMAKRLKYTKELLTTMLNGNTPQGQIPTINFQ